MPVRHRKPNEVAQQVLPLMLLGIALIASNRYFTFVDEEVRSLENASQPLRTLFAQFLSASGQNEVPPLYGAVLHFWLHWTSWNFEYLRIPAIFFFLVGLFLLGRAALRIGGPESAAITMWLGVLWPFGFFYGRLAQPTAFVFFLVAGLTFAYLRFLEKYDFARSAALFLFGLALLWSTLFGWAVLACLAIDQLLRLRSGEGALPVRVMARTVILWIAAFVPISRSTYRGFIAAVNIHHRLAAVVTNYALQIYNLFVSESVAPWHWQLSVPAALAVLACIGLVFANAKGSSRRFLVYGAVLIIFMGATGTLVPRQSLFIAPWLLLPIAIAIGSTQSRWARPSLALALLLVAGIGWTGIYWRSYYSAPEFLENWAQLAGDAADKIQTGAGVISNSRPFFFYLTYAVRVPMSSGEPKVDGLLPDAARFPRVATAEQWLSTGHSISPTMISIRGTADGQTEEAMNNATHILDQSCGAREYRLMMRDQGDKWKQRFLPESAGPIWRIEVRQYDCASSNSKEILSIPVPEPGPH